MLIFLTFFSCILALYLFRNLGWLFNVAQPQRDIAHFASEKKKHKPIPCGGIVFVLFFTVYCYIFEKINYQYWALIGFFAVGFFDDLGKVMKKSHISFVSGKFRLLAEIVIAGFFAYFFVGSSSYIFEIKSFGVSLKIPFLIALPLIILVIIGTINAVNLTDGQDGLAGKTMIVHLFFVLTISGFEIITIGVMVCLLAFLLFNSKPATVYMGDAGSMFLGGYLVFLYFNNKIEWVLPITGIVFIVETISVILQVISFKITGKRIFKMSPFHHHLEKSGISEEKTVTLAFCVTAVVCLVMYNFI